ncbi:MAG TPA: DUF397 domain-containing protein [Mycobacteriales bacterium]|nr:DUF397 domain-containing protein [Mycobacteriales bacterium]
MSYNGTCTDPIGWRVSSYCSTANSGCVAVSARENVVTVRDDKDPAGPVLRFTTAEWRVFVLGMKAGEFDV